MLTDLVELADVRMTHARGGTRLAPEALTCHLIVRRVANHLEGDGSLQPFVLGGVYDAHAALPEPADNAVVSDSLGQWRFRHSTVSPLRRGERSLDGVALPID